MATSAFKSTTRRAPVEASSPSTDDSASSSSSKIFRRSRSLSRFSRPIPTELELDVLPTPRRKFVSTVRGSDFPEISLDDLAIEFSPLKDKSSEVECDRGSRITRKNSESSRRSRSVSRHSNGTAAAVGSDVNGAESSQTRGRSVSRRNDGTVVVAGGTTRAVPETNLRRRRSISVARYHISDSESDLDHSRSSVSQTKMRNINNGNNQSASFQKPTASSQRRSGRFISQKPVLRSHDGYSSYSSVLTDDESRDASYGKNEIEKTIQAVYAKRKIEHPTGDDVNHGLYEAMRKELRSAVNEIMIEREQAMKKKPSAMAVHDRLHSTIPDVFQTVSSIKKNNATKLKPMEKCKPEEQRGMDGSKIVREVPNFKSNVQRVSHSRKRSNDKNSVSIQLNEEAEKYFEDFISSVDDTDFSSFEGEKSDTSSTLGGSTKRKGCTLPSQKVNSLPVEMEGINLPWLTWGDTDVSPCTSQNTTPPPVTPKPLPWDPSQDLNLRHEQNSQATSRLWNSQLVDAFSTNKRESKVQSEPRFDMGRYVELQREEELLYERWKERNLIDSGGLLLCGNLL